MTRVSLTLMVCVIAIGASGCQLIADFDRSKIPTDAGQLPDGSVDEDAGSDDGGFDGGVDATLPVDAAQDAAQDADTDDDAGTGDDAGTDDAG